MIQLWSTDSGLRSEIERTADGYVPICHILDWNAFELNLRRDDCSIVAISLPLEDRVLSLLVRLIRGTALPDADAIPVLVVTNNESLPYATRTGGLQLRSIARSEVKDALVASITSECARATLRYIRNEVDKKMKLHPALRRAICCLLRFDVNVSGVRALSHAVSRSESTLQHYWANDGVLQATKLTLKEFVDSVVLLKARVRKTTTLITWDDVATAQQTSVRHLQEVSRRLTGSWLGDRLPTQWVELSREIKHGWMSF